MNTLIQGVQNKQNIVVTCMRGLERSKLLLRSELALLTSNISLKKIYHVLDKDTSIDRVHYEAAQMPFGEFEDIVVSKFNSSYAEGPPSSPDSDVAQLIICHLKYVFNKTENATIGFDSSDALIVFDDISLENLESACSAAQEHGDHQSNDSLYQKYSPGLSFGQLATSSRSVVLACNPPIKGLEAELNCRFEIVISGHSLATQQRSYKVFSSILPRGLSFKPFKFGGLDLVADDNKSRLYSDSGTMLETVSEQIESGGVLVFFPSYGKMVEYHNAWQQLGFFEKIGLPYGRENRGGSHFKNGLIKLTKNQKSIFLCSIRYHQDEDLAEFVTAQARAVIVVGLPYLFLNDTWYARFEHNDTLARQEHEQTILSGKDLYKYRAIEFLNGIVKRCLNEYRYKDCSFFFLDEALENSRDELTLELGDVPVESFSQAMARHRNF